MVTKAVVVVKEIELDSEWFSFQVRIITPEQFSERMGFFQS